MLNQSPEKNEPFDLWAFLQRQDVQQWIIAGVAIGTIILIVRRSHASPGMTVAASALASALMQNQHIPVPPDQVLLTRALKTMAQESELRTPTELWSELKEHGMYFSTPQQMGQVLSALGLQSTILTRPGRTERRWYDLATWKADENHDHAA